MKTDTIQAHEAPRVNAGLRASGEALAHAVRLLRVFAQQKTAMLHI